MSKSAYCKDKVGNDSSKSGSYKVVKKGTSCSYCSCTSYDYYWWHCDKGYDNTDQNCKSTGGGSRNGITCNASNVGVDTASGNHHSTCCRGSCNGCGPCWY